MKIRLIHVASGVMLLCVGFLTASLLVTKDGVSFPALFDPKYAVIWSGVLGATIAAIISLVGVTAANKSSLDRLDRQHRYDAAEATAQRSHDAQQKDEDRKAAIRREVYTKVAEEVHAVLAVIGGLPERPLSERATDVEGLQLFLKANAKVWLVAESDAALLSRELTSLISELYFKTLRAAYPLRLAMEPVRDLERESVHAESEIRRLDTRIAELKERNGDFQEQEAVANAWVKAHEWLKTVKVERDRQVRALGPNRLAHAKILFEDMQSTQQTIVRLVSALRKELHLQPDEKRFLAQLIDMEARALAALNRSYGIESPDVPT